VKTDSGAPEEERVAEPGSIQREVRTCPVCGTKFFAATDCGFCPVCILREAAGSESTLGEAPNFAAGSPESSPEAKSAQPVASFENYQLILHADGKPIVLGGDLIPSRYFVSQSPVGNDEG
jgi:hypothetical protein